MPYNSYLHSLLMTPEPFHPFQIPDQYYTALFEAMPGNSLLINNDSAFTILAATPAYLEEVGYTKDELIGKGTFEAFPANDGDPDNTGGRDLLSSFRYVLEHKKAHILPMQRYDLQNDDGSFMERYWRIVNTPMLAPDGKVIYIINTAEDITARLKAEKKEEAHQELRENFNKVEESEGRFRALVTAASNIIYRMNADWSEMSELQGKGFLSDSGGPMTGWAQKYVHPRDHQRVIEAIKKAVDAKSIFEMEHRVWQRDRTPGWIFSRAVPILDDKGNIIEWFGAASDITKRKEAEEALNATKEEAERQKRLYETITSNTPDLIYVFGLDYRFTYANEALLAMWGKSWEDAVGKSLLENGYEPWHAEMHEREIDHVAATRESVRGEVSFPHAVLGRRIYDYILVPVINDDGNVEAVAGTTRDITEIKKAEEELRKAHERITNILESTNDAFYALDADFNFTYINTRAAQLWNRDRESLIGRHYWTEFPQAMDNLSYQKHYKALRDGKPVHFETALQPMGIWVEASIYPGTNGSLSVFFRDITERRQAAEVLERKVKERTVELEKVNQDLNRSNQNLEEFAYAASHDLKEPIRKIHFFADRLKERLNDKLEGEDRRYFERLETGAARMSTLIDDLLLYSHISRGAASAENVDLNESLRLVLDDLELGIEEKNASVEVGHLPSVKGNKRQLQQLFENLVGNALKYSKPGQPPKVNISSRVVQSNELSLPLMGDDAEKSFHLIEVADNGIGFEQEDAERIFNVFTRLHGNSEYKGTGVGLSIVRKVVENHGGYIWAYSVPGEGASFKIILPAG